VRFFLKTFSVDNKSLILDPFSGRGTTVIECKKNNIPSLGFEINPLLQIVGDYSSYWSNNKLSLLKNFIAELKEQINVFSNRTITEIIEKLNTEIPNIYNVFRWWKSPVLRDLILARNLARKNDFEAVLCYLSEFVRLSHLWI
jgi:hypothetical protein